MWLQGEWVSVIGGIQSIGKKEKGERRMENEAAAQQFSFLLSRFANIPALRKKNLLNEKGPSFCPTLCLLLYRSELLHF